MKGANVRMNEFPAVYSEAAAQWMDRLRLKCWDTYEHSVRVCWIASKMTPKLGLDAEQGERLLWGCLLHDIGKIELPDELLRETGPLNATQMAAMRRHPVIGARLLSECGVEAEEIVMTVRHHHERWDGMGYPNGLEGASIPYFARVCAVIDAFDCMMSDRPYRRRLEWSAAERELKVNADRQFDGRIVEMLLDLAPRLRMMYE